MCGSEECLDREYGMMKTMLSNVREDGLLYYPIDRPASETHAIPT